MSDRKGMKTAFHLACLGAVSVLAILFIDRILPLVDSSHRKDMVIPSFQEVRNNYRKSDAYLYDRHGEVIHELRIDFRFRRLRWTPLAEVSPALRKAVLWSEDRRFFQHHGVDWLALLTSAFRNLVSGERRGASTITMQLASVLMEGIRPEGARRTIARKWKQIRAARAMEKTWSKEEILEAYGNLVSFRGELQGISAASRVLFGKDPSGLNETESLILASLIRSPEAPVEAVIRRACLLGASMKAGTNREEIAARSRETLSGPYVPRPGMALAPHVAAALLRNGKEEAMSTLDGRLQKFASEIVKYSLGALEGRNVRDGAILVVENGTGEVLAYVANGGTFSSARFVNGIRAKRQAGSTLKPFLYALAFEKHYLTPASLLKDTPVDVPTSGGIYSPDNYDSRFRGMVTARMALASSMNVPAVRTLALVGEDSFVRKLDELGFQDLKEGEHYGLSLALGTPDVSLWELVNAYRTLANGGVRNELKITASGGKGTGRRVFSRETAFLVSHILSDREARSPTFDLENPLSTSFWTAVKTGTSKEMRDNWCVGYSRKYTVGVWVGNFSGEPMWDVSGMTGAAPLWFGIMKYLHKDASSAPPPAPKGVLVREVVFPDEGVTRQEWFLKGTETDVVRKEDIPASAKILYPALGEVIALDPDIPPGRQRIFFESSSRGCDYRWMLNGQDLGCADKVSWPPERGTHNLALADGDNHVVNDVTFTVR
jgi:penicillin-binding protein 1C